MRGKLAFRYGRIWHRTSAVAAASVLIASSFATTVRAGTPSVELQISWTRPGDATVYSPPSALLMGDEVTVHIAMTDIPQPACQTVFAGGGADHNYPSMWVFAEQGLTNDCPDWTFVVPRSPATEYRIETTAVGSDLSRATAVVPINIGTGGTPVAFSSNYPLVSWAPEELFGTATLAFGSPITVPVPPDANHCQVGFNGSWVNSFRLNSTGCSPWVVTVPELRPDFATSGSYSWPWQNYVFVSADATSSGSRRINGTTYALETTLDGDGSANDLTSSLPVAVFQASKNPYFQSQGSVTLTPTIVGMTAGSCEYSGKTPSQSGFPLTETVPIVDGSCAPFTMDAQEFGGYQYFVRIVDTNDLEVTQTSSGFDVVAPIPPPVVDVPPDPPAAGEDVPVDVSVADGSALTYSVSVTQTTLAASATTAGTESSTTSAAAFSPESVSCVGATGQLDVLNNDRDARAICRFSVAGTYRVSATMTDALGTTRTTTKMLTVVASDATPPTATAPTNRFASGSTVNSSSPLVQLAWSGSDVGTGIAHYVLAQSTDGGAFTTVSGSVTSVTVNRPLRVGHTYRFRVRAVDHAGNVGVWVYGASFRIRGYQEGSTAVHWRGTWRSGTSTAYWGGRDRYANAAGARATLTFTGRSFAWVGSTGPTRGYARVYVNGTLVKTINLHATSSHNRQILFATRWSTSASRTISIRVSGTAGHPRVDLDALVVAS